jgi:hypothetical protein
MRYHHACLQNVEETMQQYVQIVEIVMMQPAIPYWLVYVFVPF